MRFRKLRFAVGIALIVFLFVAGSIVVLGKLTNAPGNDLSVVDPKAAFHAVPAAQNTTVAPESSPEPPAPVKQTVPQNTPAPAPQPVVHLTRRTRAS